jgi:putative integral membrane protein (TIGR02587 family)
MAEEGSNNVVFAKGLSRAFGGALIFSLPIFLTGETWWLGFYIDRVRLMLLLIVLLPILACISYFVGFKETTDWKSDVLDAFVAYGVGVITASVILPLLSIVQLNMSLNEIVGKIAIQAVPASIGAVHAGGQFGVQRRKTQDKRQKTGYIGELFIMGVGALFLALNLAPIRELAMLAHIVTWSQAAILVVLSLLVMQAFAYGIDRQHAPDGRVPIFASFVRMTMAGYAVSLAISLFMLWSFARTDGMATPQVVRTLIVLTFPASIGAAASRVIL